MKQHILATDLPPNSTGMFSPAFISIFEFLLRKELPLIDFTLVALAVGSRRPPRFSEVSFPFSKLSHILSGTSKWLKFGGRKEGETMKAARRKKEWD